MSLCRAVVIALAALATTASAGCGGEEPLPERLLVIASGRPGGVYLEYGRGLAVAINRFVPSLRARTIGSRSSVHNVELLLAGEADIGFTRADSATSTNVVDGRIVALARLYDSYVQIVVRADSAIGSIADLERCGGAASPRRCCVAIGPQGSRTRLVARRVLTAAGLAGRRGVRERDLDIQDEVDALADERVDAIV